MTTMMRIATYRLRRGAPRARRVPIE